MEKSCSKCGLVKSHFPQSGRTKTGKTLYKGYCQDCENAIVRDRNAANPKPRKERHPVPEFYLSKVCKLCREDKAGDDFGSYIHKPTGKRYYFRQCKACFARAKKERYAANPELFRQRQSDFRKNNPEAVAMHLRKNYVAHVLERREQKRQYAIANREKVRHNSRIQNARRRGMVGTYTTQQWKDCVALHDGRCAHCGIRNVKFHHDHIVPRARGGTNWIENLQPLCEPCNLRKHKKLEGEIKYLSGKPMLLPLRIVSKPKPLSLGREQNCRSPQR